MNRFSAKGITVFVLTIQLCISTQGLGDLTEAKYHYERGKRLLIEGNYKGAIEIFDKYELFDANFFRGMAKDRLGDYSGAIEDFENFVSLLHSRDSFDDRRYASTVANTCKGLAELRASRYYQAANSFDRAIGAYSSALGVYSSIEPEAKVLEQYKSSISDDDRIKALIPDFITAYIGWHIATARLEAYLAREHEEYLIFQGLDFDLAFALSFSAAGLGHGVFEGYVDAIKAYNSAIKYRPNLAIAYIGRGYVKTKLELYPDALLDFDKAIELSPNNPLIYYLRGDTKYKLGKPVDAKIDMQNALKLTTIPLNTTSPRSRGGPSTKAHALTFLIEATIHKHTNRGDRALKALDELQKNLKPDKER